MMHTPMTCDCGHSFCYGCIYSWLGNKLNCPTCRKDIENKPILNLQLKDIAKNISDLIIETTIDEDEKESIITHRKKAINEYEFDKQKHQLFGDLFNSAVTLIDTSDGVPRCGNCHWEVQGNVCDHCGNRLRIPVDEYDSDERAAYDEDDAESDGANSYDSEDSFIDNGVLRVVDLDDYSDLDFGSDTERIAREHWAGFDDSEIELDGIDEDDIGNDTDRRYNLREALENFHYEDLQRAEDGSDAAISISDVDDDDQVRPNHRRAIVISDDEDS